MHSVQTEYLLGIGGYTVYIKFLLYHLSSYHTQKSDINKSSDAVGQSFFSQELSFIEKYIIKATTNYSQKITIINRI